VAAKEAAYSPQGQVVRLKKNKYKIAAVGLAFVLLACVKWFVIGYFVGSRDD
jgi:hypothetical protein